MANRDGVFSDQDLFYYKPHDPLAFIDTEHVSRTTQAGEERREGFREAQEGRSIVGLVSDCFVTQHGASVRADAAQACVEPRRGEAPQTMRRLSFFVTG